MKKIKFPNATGAKTCEGLDIIQWSEYYPAAEVDRLLEVAERVPKAYQKYRNRGVNPAPDEYAYMVAVILELGQTIKHIMEK